MVKELITMNLPIRDIYHDYKLVADSIVDDKSFQKADAGILLSNLYDVVKALEKQIPIKPREINEERIRLDGIWDWSCGNCGRFHRNDYPLNYCNECGQKVDWSEWK